MPRRRRRLLQEREEVLHVLLRAEPPAHLGGFIAGVLLIKLFARPDDVRAHTSTHWEPRRVVSRW